MGALVKLNPCTPRKRIKSRWHASLGVESLLPLPEVGCLFPHPWVGCLYYMAESPKLDHSEPRGSSLCLEPFWCTHSRPPVWLHNLSGQHVAFCTYEKPSLQVCRWSLIGFMIFVASAQPSILLKSLSPRLADGRLPAP